MTDQYTFATNILTKAANFYTPMEQKSTMQWIRDSSLPRKSSLNNSQGHQHEDVEEHLNKEHDLNTMANASNTEK